MNKDVFKLMISFHAETATNTLPNYDIVSAVEDWLVNDKCNFSMLTNTALKRVKKLANSLVAHRKNLEIWNDDNAYDIYSSKRTKKPSKNSFSAALEFVNSDSDITSISNKYNVNYQCIKAMAPRIQRYYKYADMLKKLK